MKFKVGDKVRVVKIEVKHNPEVKIGDIQTVKKIYEDGDIMTNTNLFRVNEIELVEEGNKFKLGQKVRIKRTGEIKKIIDIDDLDYYYKGSSNLCYGLENTSYYTVHDLEEVEEILEEKEKEYLNAVIKPFKRYVYYIEKVGWEYEDEEYIRIVIKKENEEHIHLPYFEKNSMYKGMEINKEYTLEELGL